MITHEFIPSSSNAVVSEAHTISLDLRCAVGTSIPPPSISDLDLASSRNRIVIHPHKNSKFTESKSTLPPQLESISKNANEQASKSIIVEITPHSMARPVAVEGKSIPIPQQQVPSPRLRENDWEAEKVGKLAQVRQAMGRIDKKPIQKRPPSPRVVNLGSVTPVMPIPIPEFQSPYLEEYAKCGCTKHGGNPCRRCQLMLLSDRQVECYIR